MASRGIMQFIWQKSHLTNNIKKKKKSFTAAFGSIFSSEKGKEDVEGRQLGGISSSGPPRQLSLRKKYSLLGKRSQTSPRILWISEDGILLKPTVHFGDFLVWGFVFNDLCWNSIYLPTAVALTNVLC